MQTIVLLWTVEAVCVMTAASLYMQRPGCRQGLSVKSCKQYILAAKLSS
jgi:hypothetical protein